jgi:hypothetical protein|uniref:Uncharacterized protein n=1 Tax=Podoviridae sp. ctz6O13 TaxID=2827757 RepID=A0A8S5TKB6_9CAUD|nr:MAG TPA: hypothetical protein [Podoviridae sp. ctz6O13]
MACKYIYNGKEYGSYQDLVASLSDEDMSSLADILFSKNDKQNIVYDKINKIRKSITLSKENVQIMDGSPDIASTGNNFTTQTFINSQYFLVDGEPPMFRHSTQEYVETVKRKAVESKEMTEAQADAWGNLVQEKWDYIADNALDFHKLILGDSTASLTEWAQRTAGTVFSGITEKVMEAEKQIFYKVLKGNGRSVHTGEMTGKVMKSVGLQADLRNMVEKITGHIDYLVVGEDGSLDLYNVKTSTEPYSQWAPAKKEKYRYQLALLKRMLAFHGIDSAQVRVHIIPVQLKYDSNFNDVVDIEVQQAMSYDTKDLKYIFQKYDRAAEQFIDSTVDFSQADNMTLLKVSKQLQHIFPGKDVRAQGIAESAKEWIKRNWNYCHPETLPDGGWKLTLPDTGEEIEVSDPRKGDRNEEFVRLMTAKLSTLDRPFSGEISASYLRRDLKKSFQVGYFASNSSGELANYIRNQFTKYLNDYTEKSDSGERTYRWEIVESPLLDAANIIVLRNKESGQMDVFTISGTDPSTKYSFKGRENLLSYYLPDTNEEQFDMKSNYGNIDAIRTVALLNEVLPEVGGDIKLGQLKVLGIGNFKGKRGVYYEFEPLLRQWDTIVKIVNKNSSAQINNNFREKDIRCIAPEEVLWQVWQDIVTDNNHPDLVEIRRLKDVLDRKALVDGTAVDGLMNVQTIEGKIEKLEELLDRLRSIAEERGINIKDQNELINISNSLDPVNGPIAKLYIETAKALSSYYGDIALDNEAFSAFEEYSIKMTSMGNSSARRVGFLTKKSIDNARAEILDGYMLNIQPIIRKFYEDAGYSEASNNIIGNQAKVYQNLYQRDDSGVNLMLFKNPYDGASDLKPYEREFLKNILYELYKVYQNMNHLPLVIKGPNDPELIKNMPKTYLYVPLQQASTASKALNIKEGLSQWGKKVQRLFTKPGEVFEEALGNLDAEDIELRDSAIDALRVYNPYSRSYTSLRERDMYIADKGIGFFETNLENICVDFLSRQVQCDEFNKLLIRIKGIELALTLKGIAEDDMENVKHTIKAIDDFVTINIHNKSIMENFSKKLDAWLAPLRKLVSRLYIASNPVGMVRDFIQGLEANFVSSLVKFQTDVSAKDVAFGYSEVFKEGCTNLMKMTKLNQFNIRFGLSNFDAARVAERLKTGRGGVLNYEYWMYYTLRAPDYLNRMTLFVAKMHKDGVYDAYTLNEDHRLVYNWRLDKRFSAYAVGNTADPKYNEQKALYFSMIRAFNIERNGKKLAYTDDLPDAYTPSQIRSIKTLGESIYGAFDQSSRSKYEFVAIGRNFMFFTTWMNGMVDNYFKRRQVSQSELKLVQETDYNGNPLFFTDDNSGNTTTEDTGKPVMKDVPLMVQGIFFTFKEAFREIHENGWNVKSIRKYFTEGAGKNEINRRNMRRALSDLAVAMILTALFKMWLTPEYKRHKAEADGKELISNVAVEMMYKASLSSFDVFKGPAAMLTYLGESTSPATYKVQTKVLKDLTNFALGDKTLGQTVMNSQAFFRSMQDSYAMYKRDTK